MGGVLFLDLYLSLFASEAFLSGFLLYFWTFFTRVKRISLGGMHCDEIFKDNTTHKTSRSFG